MGGLVTASSGCFEHVGFANIRKTGSIFQPAIDLACSQWHVRLGVSVFHEMQNGEMEPTNAAGEISQSLVVAGKVSK